MEKVDGKYKNKPLNFENRNLWTLVMADCFMENCKRNLLVFVMWKYVNSEIIEHNALMHKIDICKNVMGMLLNCLKITELFSSLNFFYFFPILIEFDSKSNNFLLKSN